MTLVADTTHRAELELGPPIQDGVVRWCSSTLITAADHGSEGGCLRRLFFERVMGRERITTLAMTAGVGMHKEIETYLTTGQLVLGPVAMAGRWAIPEPGPGLIVEQPIILGGDGQITGVYLRCGGVPVAGHVDLYNHRGEYIDAEGELRRDPPNTLEVKDWKCLPEGVMLFDPVAARRRDVSELGELHVSSWEGIQALASAGSLGSRDNARAYAFASGHKACVTVHLNDGTDLRASIDHPIYTDRGWVPAGQLTPHSNVAVAASAPEPDRPTLASDAEVVFVAYMLADGGCTDTALRFTNMTPSVIEEFLDASAALGYAPHENAQKGKARNWTLSRNPGNRGPRLLDHVRKRWDLFGLSKEKRAHADVWGLPQHQVALFLNRFWACDGFISDHQVAIELASEKLIDDLRFLLLRLGIRSQKHKRGRRDRFSSWIITLGGARALRFLDTVGNVLGKEAACIQLRARLESRSRRGQHAPAAEGLEWARVKTVTAIGEHPVFDLTVPGNECFLADGVLVHNSTSNLKWAKSADQVAATIQMTTYAMAGFKLWPQYERARLTHVYFQRGGRPQAQLATKLVERRQIEQKWEYAESVMRRVVDAARETDPNKVEANTRACRSYNSDCPHLDVCEAGKSARDFNSLDDVMGHQMAERVLARMKGGDAEYSALDVPMDIFSALEKDNEMGLFDIIKAAPATATVTPINPPEGVGASISLDDLVAEEAATRAQLDPPPPAPMAPSPEFTQAIGVICSAPLGFPKLTGRAAVMFGTLNKHELKAGMEIPGTGKLAQLAPFEDPAAVVALGVEVRRKYPTQGPRDVTELTAAAPRVERIEPAIAILPPDAPPSNPAIAAKPVEGLDNAKARELEALTTTEIPGLAETVAAAGVLPAPADAADLFASASSTIFNDFERSYLVVEKDIAPSTPTPAAPEVIAIAPAPVAPEVVTIAAVQAPATPAPAAPAKKRGRPPKNAAATGGTDAKPSEDAPLEIFVDVSADGLEAESLAPYVRQLCATLETEFKVADIRTASRESPLGFDKWKGAVDALARRAPPKGGRYVADTRGDSITEIVVAALKVPAIESGGFVVRGAR